MNQKTIRRSEQSIVHAVAERFEEYLQIVLGDLDHIRVERPVPRARARPIRRV